MKIHAAADDLERTNNQLKQLRRNLRRIVVFYEPALDGHCDTDENDRKAPRASGEPAQLEAIAARSDAHRDLHFWCGFILDDVNQGTISTIVRDDIKDLAAFIERWAIALHDQWPEDATNLRKDARRHAEKLENLARGWSIKRIEIGVCPEMKANPANEGDLQQRCTGQLWAILQSADTLLPKRILCDQEAKHTWSPHSWRDLGRRLDASSIRKLQHSQQDAQSPQSSAASSEAS